MDLGNVTFVLHRPSSAENIGAVARALMNFGLSRLAIVAPPSWDGLPRGGGPGIAREEVLARARRTARHAAGLLESATIHVDARSALGAATWTCGTTSRLVERPRLSPRELAREVALRSERGSVALLFGEERRGLSDRELTLCQAVCSIPTAPQYESMNLAQAVTVVAYELAMEGGAGDRPPLAPAEPARHATIEALWARAAALLAEAGYLNPQNPEQILAEWRCLVARAEPTQREVELLLAGVRSLERKLKIVGAAEGGAVDGAG
jgi:tRNA/rRNA methyltransferase